jgi:hypothetical protein
MALPGDSAASVRVTFTEENVLAPCYTPLGRPSLLYHAAAHCRRDEHLPSLELLARHHSPSLLRPFHLSSSYSRLYNPSDAPSPLTVAQLPTVHVGSRSHGQVRRWLQQQEALELRRQCRYAVLLCVAEVLAHSGPCRVAKRAALSEESDFVSSTTSPSSAPLTLSLFFPSTPPFSPSRSLRLQVIRVFTDARAPEVLRNLVFEYLGPAAAGFHGRNLGPRIERDRVGRINAVERGLGEVREKLEAVREADEERTNWERDMEEREEDITERMRADGELLESLETTLLLLQDEKEGDKEGMMHMSERLDELADDLAFYEEKLRPDAVKGELEDARIERRSLRGDLDKASVTLAATSEALAATNETLSSLLEAELQRSQEPGEDVAEQLDNLEDRFDALEHELTASRRSNRELQQALTIERLRVQLGEQSLRAEVARNVGSGGKRARRENAK